MRGPTYSPGVIQDLTDLLTTLQPNSDVSANLVLYYIICKHAGLQESFVVYYSKQLKATHEVSYRNSFK